MALEITGKLVQVLPELTGTGKSGSNWVKQNFVIEIAHEQFPKKVCFVLWGDKTQVLKTLSTGSQITVAFDVESREFNGKWYTDLKAWKVAAGGSTSPNSDFNQEPIATNSMGSDLASFSDNGAKDDLPF